MKARRRVAGLHAVEAALLRHPERILAAWVDADRVDRRLSAVTDALGRLGIRPQAAHRGRLDALAEGQAHQGVVIEMTLPAELDEHALQTALEAPGPAPLFLVLDHVQDPHNLGACLRTADAAGVQGVVLTRDQAAGITPVVAKVASGAAETMPIWREPWAGSGRPGCGWWGPPGRRNGRSTRWILPCRWCWSWERRARACGA